MNTQRRRILNTKTNQFNGDEKMELQEALMSKTYYTQERRRHKRFVINTDKIAYAVLRPPVNKIGKVIDISLTGLAFSYFSANGEVLNSSRIDILTDEGLFLEDIPYSIVNDCIISSEQPFKQITTHRHSVQFRNLSENQVLRIQSFIDTYGHNIIPES
ncbi:MAG: PilZ domain-containing protein [Desulfobulbaceae bacterium]|uniref:PilZ domain-containing protein n=1 Tax=Candidatus Desulfobia pelagia TaxID=2841692 RepID=A0A8J6TFV3_9BACT|nr:PilZ domain-containing protein [Candidatus Desulfobia pelagia]